MNWGVFTTLLTLFLFAPLFFKAADTAQQEQVVSEPERIDPTWQVTEVLVRVYWMNGQAVRTTWNRKNPDDPSVEDDEWLKGFSECDDPEDWESDVPYTECDLYAPFPKYVDDDMVCTIGHEVMHGFAGDYHGDQ